MKTVLRNIAGILLFVAVLLGVTTQTLAKESQDKTLSPYFFVQSSDASVDSLPLKSTAVDATISGVIADVVVKQTYKNEGKTPLEAIYVFPASTRAAVYAMKMTIGSRVIEAKIKKRDEARADYEEAKRQGKSASLLEEERPNVFQMNVANIMPGDTIAVEMKYAELLVPTNKEYAFVYPTVVGPRYSNKPEKKAKASESWIKNPFLHQGEAPTSSFAMTTKLLAGMPIQSITSPSHKVTIAYEGKDKATVSLDASESFGGNRDVVIKYALAGDRVQSGLLLSKSDKGNHFLLMMEPPKRVTTTEIPAREYIFIMDVSGSMYGYPLDISKKLLKDLVANLRPTDRFNVLLFAGGQAVLSGTSLPATAENAAKAIAFIDKEQGGGGTELLPALKAALALPRAKGTSRTVVIATDGYVTVEEEVFDLIRDKLGEANMFAFGIGTSVNRFVIEGMAHVGMGEPFVITKPEEATATAAEFRTLIQSPVLAQVKVAFDGFEAYDVTPKSVPDVLADRPVIVFGKWKGEPKGTITVTGVAGNGPWSQSIDVAASTASTDPALAYLWARHRIMILGDYNGLNSSTERTNEITNLGLTYNLLTPFTSFIAVDSDVRNQGGKSSSVTQPLPLPQGVSDYAVGNHGSLGGIGGSGAMMAAKAMPMAAAPREMMAMDVSEPSSMHAGGYSTLPVLPPAKPVDDEEKKERIALPKTAPASIALESIRVTGALTEATLRSTIESHLSELNRCGQGLGVGGRIVVTLVIDAGGNVTGATIFSSEGHDTTLEACLTKTLKGWTFDKATAGTTTTAAVAFMVTR